MENLLEKTIALKHVDHSDVEEPSLGGRSFVISNILADCELSQLNLVYYSLITWISFWFGEAYHTPSNNDWRAAMENLLEKAIALI